MTQLDHHRSQNSQNSDHQEHFNEGESLINTFALHALVLTLSVAWQAFIQQAPHLYVTAAIALGFKAVLIPVVLHRIIRRLGIHREIETVVGVGPTMLAGMGLVALAMVVIASMIGAGGLGYQVLQGIGRLEVSRGLFAGLGIVILSLAMVIGTTWIQPAPAATNDWATATGSPTPLPGSAASCARRRSIPTRPWSWTRRCSAARTSSAPCGSNWLVGSSSRITLPPLFSTFARWTRLRSPPDSSPTKRC